MTLRLGLLCHLQGLVLLRCASLLVPGRQRMEWWKEWQAELWHVRQACTPKRGISFTAEREVAAFCFGAFEDACCLRNHSGLRRMPRPTPMGSAMQCLLLLSSLMVASYGIALLLPGVSAVLHSSHYRDGEKLMLIQDAQHPGDSIPTISEAQYQFWKARQQELFDGFAFYQVKQESVSSPSPSQGMLGVAHASANLFGVLGLPVQLSSEEGKARSDVPEVILSEKVR